MILERTVLDLNGAKINLAAIGDVSGLECTFTLLGADQISGEATVIVPEALQGLIDTSALLTNGTITFGNVVPGLVGDINMNGSVDFPDFLALSGAFNTECDGCPEDINGNGTVDFPDFLALSGNFGMTAANAAVPEPTSFALLGVAGLLGGLLRRRQS